MTLTERLPARNARRARHAGAARAAPSRARPDTSALDASRAWWCVRRTAAASPSDSSSCGDSSPSSRRSPSTSGSRRSAACSAGDRWTPSAPASGCARASSPTSRSLTSSCTCCQARGLVPHERAVLRPVGARALAARDRLRAGLPRRAPRASLRRRGIELDDATLLHRAATAAIARRADGRRRYLSEFERELADAYASRPAGSS